MYPTFTAKLWYQSQHPEIHSVGIPSRKCHDKCWHYFMSLNYLQIIIGSPRVVHFQCSASMCVWVFRQMSCEFLRAQGQFREWLSQQRAFASQHTAYSPVTGVMRPSGSWQMILSTKNSKRKTILLGWSQLDLEL